MKKILTLSLIVTMFSITYGISSELPWKKFVHLSATDLPANPLIHKYQVLQAKHELALRWLDQLLTMQAQYLAPCTTCTPIQLNSSEPSWSMWTVQSDTIQQKELPLEYKKFLCTEIDMWSDSTDRATLPGTIYKAFESRVYTLAGIKRAQLMAAEHHEKEFSDYWNTYLNSVVCEAEWTNRFNYGRGGLLRWIVLSGHGSLFDSLTSGRYQLDLEVPDFDGRTLVDWLDDCIESESYGKSFNRLLEGMREILRKNRPNLYKK